MKNKGVRILSQRCHHQEVSLQGCSSVMGHLPKIRKVCLLEKKWTSARKMSSPGGVSQIGKPESKLSMTFPSNDNYLTWDFLNYLWSGNFLEQVNVNRNNLPNGEYKLQTDKGRCSEQTS